MSEMYYIDQQLYKRVGTVDSLVKDTSNSDYISSRVLDLTQSFVAATDTVILNTAGTYLLKIDIESLTANVELTVDTNKIIFKQLLTTIVSPTSAISIKSSITTNINVIAVKI